MMGGLLFILIMLLLLVFTVIIPLRVSSLQRNTAHMLIEWFSEEKYYFDEMIDNTSVELLTLEFERKMISDLTATCENWYAHASQIKKWGIFKTVDRAAFDAFLGSQKIYYTNKMLRKRHSMG